VIAEAESATTDVRLAITGGRMRMALRTLLVAISTVAIVATPAARAPLAIKVVVVTMFERGEDIGDQPGELQRWVEREALDQVHPFPQGWRNLRSNADGVLAVCTGIGTAKAAAAVMALGLDARFDLRNAYWLIAGIAGIDPEDGSPGSAVWAEWVIDADLAHEIDAREIPADWATGYVPLRKTRPYEQPRREPDEGETYRLQRALVDWAFRLTRDIELDDTPAMREQREKYGSHAAARSAPRVMKGDTLSGGTFWHGRRMSEWANAWVRYHTAGQGNYVTTAMEDTGSLQALTFLDALGRVDKRRVLVLRTASNFDQQRDGITAAESLAETKIGSYTAYLPAIDAAHRVGSVVVRTIVREWSKYRDTLPE
jgi:purine nucleoside permease